MPVLVVQMGHSGRTSGATGAPGEMAFTEAVGASCARLLSRAGWSVRPIVADPPPAQYRGDAFFAVHADGSTNPTVRGASVGYQTNEGRDLAHMWRAHYVTRGFTGPWHPDNYTTNLAQYYGVRAAVAQGNRRACIVEAGTITNEADRALMLPDRVALAIGDALGITEEDDMYNDADRQRDLAMAYRVEALVNGWEKTRDDGVNPVPNEAVPLVINLRALEGRVEALLKDQETVTWPEESTPPEENALGTRLAVLEDKLDELLSRGGTP